MQSPISPQTMTSSSTRRLRSLYIAVAFLYWTSLYLYMPTLPLYIETKTQNMALVGGVLAMYGLWQMLVRLPLGIVADWLGQRKPFIIFGLALSGLGAYLLGSAGTIPGLTVGRAITGLAAGTWVPLVVIYTSLFPPEDVVRASAVATLVSSLSRMLATSVTGFLNNAGGFSLAFYLSAGVAGLAVLVTLIGREKPRPVTPPSLTGIGRLVLRRDVLIPSLLSAVAQYTVWATTFSFLPLLAQNFGAGGVLQSALVTMNIALLAIGNFLTAQLLRWVDAHRLVFASFILTGVGILVLATASSLAWVFVAQALVGLAAGINYPVLMGMSIAKVDEGERTTAMGVYQSVYAIGMFAGPWLSGILAERIGLQPMFAVTAAACLALGLPGSILLRRLTHTPGKFERGKESTL